MANDYILPLDTKHLSNGRSASWLYRLVYVKSGQGHRAFHKRGVRPAHTSTLALRLMRVLRSVKLVVAVLATCTSLLCMAADPVPNTLEEAFALLNEQLPAAERQRFQNTPEREAVVLAHMGLGMYIRNEWFRAGRSALPAALQAEHLDDASAIVLTSYWRHLNAKPLDVKRQVSCYRRWWQEQQRLIGEAKAKGSSSYGTPAFSCPEG